jgi:hypothetical protein
MQAVRAPKAAPSLARTEIVSKPVRSRFEAEIEKAMERRPAHEPKLAGALRAVAPLSPALQTALYGAAETLVRRKSFGRELYGASIRALAEVGDKRTGELLKRALAADDAGGSSTLAAACLVRDPVLAAPLAKIASSRQSHLAFAAETARVARGESNGAHLLSLAPMIKESHRISLCVELFVPLARSAPLSLGIAPALEVVREAERHLGRWLVLAEVAVKAGDRKPLEEAEQKSGEGPQSSRAAWSLVAWSLRDTLARSGLGAAPPPPQTRPTVELIARLSDRPSADRDPAFLFRMARGGAPSPRAMLEALVKGTGTGRPSAGPLGDDVAVRAAMYLARDHGRDDLRSALVELAKGSKGEELRGLAMAALWDVGMRSEALAVADELALSKTITNVGWASLVRAASVAASGGGAAQELVTEPTFRWLQWGWLE